MDKSATILLLCFLIVDTVNASKPYHSSHIHREYRPSYVDHRLYHRTPSGSGNGFSLKERTLEDSAPQFTASMVKGHHERDRNALLSLRKAFIDPYGFLADWMTNNSRNVCIWSSIWCKNRRVISIRLSGAGLEGTISECIANLSKLEKLYPDGNNFTGRIPESIGNLSQLNYLNLGVNRLTGNIPQSIFKLSKLTFLNLGTNMLTGTISDGIGNLKRLEQLYLDTNNFTGTIPRAIGKLHSLKILFLFSNNLNGWIPHSIGRLNSLSQLAIANTNISGTIPESISGLRLLQKLDLSKNHLEGLIPEGIGRLVALQHLILSRNKLNGSIPASLGNCTTLVRLKVSENSLSGDLNIKFPVSMEVFSAHSNNFYGALPISLANCTKLHWLDLRKNVLTGVLPHYLVFFDQLRVLSLAYNKLHGHIPPWTTNLTHLQVLDLSNNQFTGKIPSDLEKLQGYRVCNSSQFNGGGGSTGFWTDQVSGSALREVLNDQVNGNTIYENMEVVIKGYEYTIKYLMLINTVFDVSNNNLYGEIPSSIGTLCGLWLLNLSANSLEGQIPASLGKLSTLEQLDLSKNNLIGRIPHNLSALSNLGFLNVSSNKLCGQIPRGSQLDTFMATSFQRNKCLCCDLLRPCNESNQLQQCSGTSDPLQPYKDIETHNNTTKWEWLSSIDEKISLIAVGLGAGIGFAGVVAMMLMWDKAKHWMAPPKIQPFYGVYHFPR